MVVRRIVPAIAVVLLATGCSSTATAHPLSTAASKPARPASTPTPNRTASRAQVAIPAAKLPYKPAAGAPALGNVSIARTAADPCLIPGDDSGNEAQLLNAQMDVNVLIVTFEFTNPCSSALTYDFRVTQAIGSSSGPSGGPSAEASTPVIQPGRSISFRVNVDPKASLSSADLQRLWVGVTHIAKGAAY